MMCLSSVFRWRVMAILLAILPAWLCLARAHAGQPKRPVVRMHLACARSCVSGSVLWTRLQLINRSPLPLQLDALGFGHVALARFYVRLSDASGGPGGRVLHNANGRHNVVSLLPGSKTLESTPVVPAGNSVAWLRGYSPASYYDMTRPGKYRLAIATRQGLYLVRKKVWQNGHAVSIGQHFYLPAPWEARTLAPRARRWKPIMSNFISVAVDAPYHRLRSAALMLTHGSVAKFAPVMTPGLHVELVGPTVKGPGPIVVRALFVHKGRNPAIERLTGNPFLDFRAIQVQGPTSLDRVARVGTPKPHEVVTQVAAPRRTAYGRWITKHPPGHLKQREYALRPDMAYKYAEPINLSCQYDMSLPGVYRVRVELANTHTWSPWRKITVLSR